ncbi:MAG: carboxypeptidase regulatory-like domain-containing protein, partial [Planctomycetota bacterium]
MVLLIAALLVFGGVIAFVLNNNAPTPAPGPRTASNPDANDSPDADANADHAATHNRNANVSQNTASGNNAAAANQAPATNASTDPPPPLVEMSPVQFTGRALNGMTGAPAEGKLTVDARVIHASAAIGSAATVELKAAGYFSLSLQLPKDLAAGSPLRLEFVHKTSDDAPDSSALRATLSTETSTDVTNLGTIVLRPDGVTGRVVGTVRDLDGKAIAGAHVTLHDHGTPDNWGNPGAIDQQLSTDAGAFAFVARPGKYAVVVRADGFGTMVSPSQKVAAGGEATFNITLTAGVQVTGVVTEAGADTPIAGATVVVVQMGETSVGAASGSTDAEGRYTIGGLNASGYLLVAFAKGYGTEAQQVALTSPGPTEQNFALKPGVTLQLRVIDAEGNPVPHYIARAWRESEGDTPQQQATGQSFAVATPVDDPDGRTEIAGIEPGEYAVEVADNQHARTIQKGVQVGADGGRVEITLVAGSVLRGHVRESGTGAPVEGARVAMQRTILVGNGQQFPYAPSAEVVTVSGADGSYELPGLPSGSVQMLVSHESHPPVQMQIKLEEGKAREFDFEMLANPGRLSGIAYDLDGKPAPNRAIVAQGGPGRQQRAQADGEGKFTFDQLPPNTYLLMLISTTGAVEASTTVAVQGGDDLRVDLGLDPGSVLVEGDVFLGETGAPNAALLCGLKSGDTDRSTIATTDSAGHFRVRLQPGDYSVLVQRNAPAPTFTFRMDLGVMASGMQKL